MLLLRPFAVDQALSINNPDYSGNMLFPSNRYEDATISLERLLAQAIKPELQLKVIGGNPIGPGVIESSDSEWRDKFHDLAARATGIIVIPLPGEEIDWECEQLRHNDLLDKTVFFIVSKAQLSYQNQDQHHFSAFFQDMKEKGFDFPLPGKNAVLLRLNQNGSVIEQQLLKKINYESLRKALRQNWSTPIPHPFLNF
jgi:hypothetical protein